MLVAVRLSAPTCVLLLRLPHAAPPREGGLQVVVQRPAAVQQPHSVQAGGLLPGAGSTGDVECAVHESLLQRATVCIPAGTTPSCSVVPQFCWTALVR